MSEQLILGLLLGFLIGDELLRFFRWLARRIRESNAEYDARLLPRRRPEGSDDE